MKEDEWDYTPENSSSRNFSKSKTMLTAGISTNRYSDFENIMHQAACMLGAEKIATGEEDPIDRKELLRLIDTQTGPNTAFKPQVVYGINVAKSIVSKMPTIRR